MIAPVLTGDVLALGSRVHPHRFAQFCGASSHLVLDNLNIHFRKCFEDILGKRTASALLRRVRFHYTPKHASWLNMAEIEIGILSRQCLDRRVPTPQLLQREVDAWQTARNNALRRTIEWKFTRQDADHKLARHYVPELTC